MFIWMNRTREIECNTVQSLQKLEITDTHFHISLCYSFLHCVKKGTNSAYAGGEGVQVAVSEPPRFQADGALKEAFLSRWEIWSANEVRSQVLSPASLVWLNPQTNKQNKEPFSSPTILWTVLYKKCVSRQTQIAHLVWHINQHIFELGLDAVFILHLHYLPSFAFPLDLVIW